MEATREILVFLHLASAVLMAGTLLCESFVNRDETKIEPI